LPGQTGPGINKVKGPGYTGFIIDKFYFSNLTHKSKVIFWLNAPNKIILSRVLTVKRFWVNLYELRKGNQVTGCNLSWFCGDMNSVRNFTLTGAKI
jgi:hypothetical protein